MVGETGQQAGWLGRVPLAGADEARSEKWLQQLLFRHVELIPITTIAPGTGGLVPVSRELGLPKAGGTVYLDMLAVTPEGRLVLVECKLWRNPQARREVLAQILEYAGLLREWSYSDLTAKLKAVLGSESENPLFELVQHQFPEVGEAEFVDRVAECLRSGDFLLIIAGDGIRSDVQTLTDQINHGSGISARLALVEFQLWIDGAGRTLVIPSLPLRTEIIRQRIVVTPEGRPVALEPEESERGGVTAADAAVSSELRDAQRSFWERFIAEAKYDHPDQPKPRHGGYGWVKIPMPVPAKFMTAYRTREGRGGLMLRLTDETGEHAFEEIRAEQRSLEQQIGSGIALHKDASDPFNGLIEITFPGNTGNSEAFLAWLLDVANRAVTALRPMLNAAATQP